MAEESLFWTTSGTGDGKSGGYTQSDLFDFFRQVFLNDETLEGVTKNFLNSLAVTGSASPMSVASGGAIVYGIPYWNDAVLNVTVTSPTGGTTGKRIVLRANWTAQTVRVTLLSNSDGVPLATQVPALTQTAGVTWDIPLAKFDITTGGVVQNLTDEREYCHFNQTIETVNIEDDAVTNAKLADNAVNTSEIVNSAVTEAKIGVTHMKRIACEVEVFAQNQAVTTGDGKKYLLIPRKIAGMNLTYLKAKHVTAGASGNTTIMIYNVTDSFDMLSGALTIVAGATLSSSYTIDTAHDDVAESDWLRFDIDTTGSTPPVGLYIVLEFETP